MEGSVKERLLLYLKSKGIKQNYFCEILGVHPTYIQSIRRSIPDDKREVIARHFPDLDMNWLITGEGDMIKAGTVHERAVPSDILEERVHVLVIENEKLKAQLDLLRELLDSYVKKA